MLEAQRSLFESEQEYIRLQQRRLVNAVDLYKALGGGWEAGPETARGGSPGAGSPPSPAAGAPSPRFVAP
ncbi:hypothetical protein G6F60_015350 [Rhizopus arrhizus]|nr:hypothetical protein G6F60_015350 [Rhizopus arrhizus]